MADITIGQLAPFITKATANKDPLRTSTSIYGRPRLGGCMLGAVGTDELSGVTYSDEVPVQRLLMILTQPPGAQVVWEGYSDYVSGAYSYPWLPPGTYTVICTDPSGEHRTLAHNHVVPG